MSLISRMEVTNYLTEGISAHRRAADWKPMLTGITLRMDGGKSALINITNGGGKTSLVELHLYLLSRDPRLLKRIREKVAPKSRGFTHARIELRTAPEDSYSAPSLLEIDPQNLPGETHVIGVVLNDDVNDPPIFYSYSGTLEDSPCYIYDGRSIISVPDSEFVARTKALRGCKWNKFTSKREWEDHIRLFLPVEVIRRNVLYQLKGSDDKNASFFDFTPRPGESYDSAFFRSVVAPDLLSNLLSSFSEEDETAVEDTLLKSLTRIVDAEREIVRKERRLQVRESGIEQLRPIMDAGTAAQTLKGERDMILRSLRKDIAFLRHFGAQGGLNSIPGIPRTLPSLGDQDPRILVALRGMVITRDDGILLLDKTLSELTEVEVRVLTQVADRKQLPVHSTKLQVIDFACDFEIVTSGSAKGGHYRKGYPRDSALAMPDAVAGISGAKVEGLKDVLGAAFDIAERLIDTNPAALQLRQLQARARQQKLSQTNAEREAADLQNAINQLELQIKDRRENQGAWDDFINIAHLLPEELRSQPLAAMSWLVEQQDTLRCTLSERDVRQGKLSKAWETYTAVMEHHGLDGLRGAMQRYDHLASQQHHIQAETTRIGKEIAEAIKSNARLQEKQRPLGRLHAEAASRLAKFDQHVQGLALYEQLFGSSDPAKIDPLRDLSKASNAVLSKQADIRMHDDEFKELASLKHKALAFTSIFGQAADPITYDPQRELASLNVDIVAARESMASLLAAKEAIEHFQDIHPGVTPADWLNKADEARLHLTKSRQDLTALNTELVKELQALEQMRSVEDGAFEQAWSVLQGCALPVQRLHQVILDAGMSLDQRQRNDILSALSGMLSAPVFDTVEDLQAAADALQHANVAVPLALRSKLVESIQRGVVRSGDTRLLGFIGGNTSRRVRILLDSEFAEAERTRMEAELAAVRKQLEQNTKALDEVDAAGQSYQLAIRAKAAAEQQAMEKYLGFESEANELERRVKLLTPQTTAQSLEVLRCARVFIERGGDARCEAIAEVLPALKLELTTLQESEEVAKTRASQNGLNARDDALAYHRLGGRIAHDAARVRTDELSNELSVVEGQIQEIQSLIESLTDLQDTVAQQAQAFEDQQGSQQLERYKITIEVAADKQIVDFMSTFGAQHAAINGRLSKLLEASRVNFERAEAFKAHQNRSDQGLQEDIDRKRQDIAKLDEIVNKAKAEVSRINDAEIPTWSRLAKAVHELAYEMGRRVARTRRIAQEASDLEEGDAVPEAHPAYRVMDTLIQSLRNAQLQAYGHQVDEVDRVLQIIQEMDLDDGIEKHKQIAAKYEVALKRYIELKADFCQAVEAQAGAPVTAFNELEVDVIRRATPESMSALLKFFEQLQASLNKERNDAQQAKRVAEDTSADTLTQLTELIVSAEDNLNILNKVMKKYPNGRFYFQTQINKDEAVLDLINDLKEEVERATREVDPKSRSMRRTDETQLKRLLRDKLIQCVFTNTSVEFVNAGIWSGKKSHVSERLSTGQKIALEFMWIVRQAEYEIERGLLELTSKQAAKSRAKANRVILIDGIFSTLSDRKIIGEALNGLRDLGGNFQIIGFLHSQTWNNDYSVFPVYHVGKKLMNSAGDGLVSFMERGREAGTVGFFSSITQATAAEISS